MAALRLGPLWFSLSRRGNLDMDVAGAEQQLSKEKLLSEKLSERAAGQSRAAGPSAMRSATTLLRRSHQFCQRRKIGVLLSE